MDVRHVRSRLPPSYIRATVNAPKIRVVNKSHFPNFENTERAFARLSSGQLHKALLLFQTVGNSGLVRFGKVLMDVALGLRIPVGWAIRPTVYSHFCGGETIAQCEQTIAGLAKGKVHTILDYSAEGKETEADLEATFMEILAAIQSTHCDDRHAFSVFKISGVAPTALLEKVSADGNTLTNEEQKAWERVQNRVVALCAAAADLGTPVLIDAEESWLQPAINDLARTAMQRHNATKAMVYNTVQLYRTDRLAYLQRLTEQAKTEGWQLGVKLVRGAYMEKERDRAAEKGYPSPIQPNKEATDRDFDAALGWCVDHAHHLSCCAGSHNEKSNALLAEKMIQSGLDPEDGRFWFAQLLGMSDHISFNLSAAGYRVAKYVPFGPIRETIPYLLRRAEENSSVAGQTSRELELIRKEVARRKQHGT